MVESSETSGGGPTPGLAGRPWLQVWFWCAGQYQRVYRSADGTRYAARCPKCAKAIRFQVGPGGSSDRFFEVSC